jgi:rRNA maturation endonuclease Nob1
MSSPFDLRNAQRAQQRQRFSLPCPTCGEHAPLLMPGQRCKRCGRVDSRSRKILAKRKGIA